MSIKASERPSPVPQDLRTTGANSREPSMPTTPTDESDRGEALTRPAASQPAATHGTLQPPPRTAHGAPLVGAPPPVSPATQMVALQEQLVALEPRYVANYYYDEPADEDPVSKAVFKVIGDDAAFLLKHFQAAIEERPDRCHVIATENDALVNNSAALTPQVMRLLAYGDDRVFAMAANVLGKSDPEALTQLLLTLTNPHASAMEHYAAVVYMHKVKAHYAGAVADQLLGLAENAPERIFEYIKLGMTSAVAEESMSESQKLRLNLSSRTHTQCMLAEERLASIAPQEVQIILRELLQATTPASFAHVFAADALGEKITLTHEEAVALLDEGLKTNKRTQVQLALKHVDLRAWPRFDDYLQTLVRDSDTASNTRAVPLLLAAGLKPINQNGPAQTLQYPERLRHFFGNLSPEHVWRLGVDGSAHALGHDVFEHREPGYNKAMAAGWNLILKDLDKPLNAAFYKEIHDVAVTGVKAESEEDAYNEGGKEIKQGWRVGEVHFSVPDNVSAQGLAELKGRLDSPPYEGWVTFRESDRTFKCGYAKEGESEKIGEAILKDLDDALRTATTPDAKLTEMCKHLQIIEQLHLFKDGNIRTMTLALNKLLLANGMAPTILEDPNCFDILSVQELVSEVQKGQASFAVACGIVA